MFSLLDTIIQNHGASAKIVSQEHDMGKIIPAAPAFDPREFAPTQATARARASLDNSTGRVALMSAGRVMPWMGLGVVIDKPCTSAEAMEFASLTWRVSKTPMQYPWKGEMRESKDTFAIVRDDTGAELGSVGARYQPIQNAEAFACCDEILARFGARYETAGALYSGEKVFLLAHLPANAFSINGRDAVEPYLAICNPHDGSGTMNIFPTATRIVCANTYRTANKQDSGKGLKIRHTGNIKAKMRDASAAITNAVRSLDTFREAAEVMATKKIDAIPYFHSVLDVVLDVTQAEAKKGFSPLDAMIDIDRANRDMARKAFEAKVERRRDILADILDRYESSTNGVNGMRGTAWSAFNAVTEHADHSRIGTRRTGTMTEQRSRRFENVLTGAADEIKQTAFAFATR